jgi:hypothetical protein
MRFLVLDLADLLRSPFGVIGILSLELGVGRGVVILCDDPSALGLRNRRFLLHRRCLGGMLEFDLAAGR